MSARVLDTLLPQLRHQPARKRLRATLAGEVVLDSTEALLVWEPQRILPAYAVPFEHIRGELLPAPATAAPAGPLGFQLPDGQTVLDPTVPFAVHTTRGQPLTLRAAGQTHQGVAFRPADPDLDGHALLDFDGFDAWYEEDEPLVGHPRDLFHRLDILPSSREVRIELDGTLLAQSTRAQLLYEHAILHHEPSDRHSGVLPGAVYRQVPGRDRGCLVGFSDHRHRCRCLAAHTDA